MHAVNSVIDGELKRSGPLQAQPGSPAESETVRQTSSVY